MATKTIPFPISITSELVLSDLFFNHEHPAFDAACANGEGVNKAAIAMDAVEFATMLTVNDKARDILADWLVEDFLERL
jgi:hypothetical protein